MHSMNSTRPRWHMCAGILLLVALAGCDRFPIGQRDSQSTPKPTSAEPPPAQISEAPRRVVRGSDEPEGTGPSEDGQLSAHGAADLAWQVVTESIEFEPKLAVWLFDRTPSAQRLVSQVTARLKEHYQELASPDDSSSSEAERLQTAVVLFGADEPEYLLETPSSSVPAVAEAFDATTVATTETENTFAAIGAATQRYAPSGDSDRDVLLFVISDEAGDDAELVDRLISELPRDRVTVYAIGSPAPWGRVNLESAAFARSPSTPRGEAVESRYGPESRELERVRIEAPFHGGELAVMDSGFGPFALEYLCRESGGVFLAIRPKLVRDYVGMIGDSWPSPYARRFPREVMRRYEPDYVPAEAYQALLQNAAAQALHQTAQVEPVARLQGPQLEFVKRDDAQFSGDLSKAQQLAASLAPDLDRLYEILKTGEGDREALTSRRWQVTYDLAMGQVCFSKARVDGYNAMLARAKRGMSFQNTSSMSWVLEPADEHADSSLQKLAQRGREYLERVVREHPQTPWAAVAELELATPAGWKWTER